MDHINPKDLEAFLKAKERDAANAAISHSDGITIYQAEQDVPGVYVDSYQSVSDTYNQALMQQQAVARCPYTTNECNHSICYWVNSIPKCNGWQSQRHSC